MASLLGNDESIRNGHMGHFARNSRNQESDGVFYARGNGRTLLGCADNGNIAYLFYYKESKEILIISV